MSNIKKEIALERQDRPEDIGNLQNYSKDIISFLEENKKLKKETLRRIFKSGNLIKGIKMGKLLRKLPLNKEIYGWHFMGKDKNIFVMGSCAFDKKIKYPKNVDYLVVPYQGHSDIAHKALELVQKINPKAVIMDHFDNAFPPVSKTIDTSEFVKLMEQSRPDIKVIVPEFREKIYL